MNSPIRHRLVRCTVHLPVWAALMAACLVLAAESPLAAQQRLAPSTGRQPAPVAQSKPQGKVVPASNRQIITTQPEAVYIDEGPIEHGPSVGGCNCGSCGSGQCGSSCGGACGSGCCGLFDSWQGKVWVRAEALSWWLGGYESTALVTTSPAGTNRNAAGVLGQAGTSVLFSGDDIGDSASAGGRYAIGTWLDPCREIGLEFNYFHVEGDGTNFLANSATAGIVARPFFNVSTGVQDSELVVFPSVVTGSIQINADTTFSGGELLIQRSWGCNSNCNITGLFGYRFQNLSDSLQFTEAITSTDTASPIEPGTTFNLIDQFETENEFHGAELGFLAELCRCNNVSLELLAKVALGNTRSKVNINGSTRIVTPSGSDTTNAGGLLALPSNSGSFEQNDFTVVPEIALRMNYQIACNWQLQFGYTFIYWSDVARSVDQIDPRLNLTQLPPGPQTGENLPQFRMVTDDFWAQGLNLGLQYDF